MTDQKIFVDRDGWIHCPFCSGKSRTKIRKNTTLVNFPLFCPKCKHETLITINNILPEPDAQTQSR